MKNLLCAFFAVLFLACSTTQQVTQHFRRLATVEDWASPNANFQVEINAQHHTAFEVQKSSQKITPIGPWVRWKKNYQIHFSPEQYFPALMHTAEQFFQDPQVRGNLLFKSFRIEFLSIPDSYLLLDEGVWFFGKKSEKQILYPETVPFTIRVVTDRYSKTYQIKNQLETMRRDSKQWETFEQEYSTMHHHYMNTLFQQFLKEWGQDLNKF